MKIRSADLMRSLHSILCTALLLGFLASGRASPAFDTARGLFDRHHFRGAETALRWVRPAEGIFVARLPQPRPLARRLAGRLAGLISSVARSISGIHYVHTAVNDARNLRREN
jgi:hypothetical protein